MAKRKIASAEIVEGVAVGFGVLLGSAALANYALAKTRFPYMLVIVPALASAGVAAFYRKRPVAGVAAASAIGLTTAGFQLMLCGPRPTPAP